MRPMKDSGVEWIGDIPENWSIIPMKSMFSYSKGLPITKADLVEKGIPVISYGQIHSKKNTGIRIENEFIRYAPIEYRNTNPLSQANEGDILFADTSEDYDGIGNCIRVDREQEVYAGYHTIIARPKDSRFSKYWAFLFQTDSWRSQLRLQASGIKVFSITQRMLNGVSLIIPSLNDGVRIAEYLVAKCTKIDALIAKQQEIIEKLKAYKLSVITEAVTKGLNPNVPMKDSGVEWIGDIPIHWDIAAVGRLSTVVRGASPRPAGDPRYFNGQDVPWITVAEVTKGEGKYIDSTETYLTAEGAMHSRTVEAGTLLLSNSGATLGVPKVTNVTGCINDGSVAFLDLKVNQMYLLYVFRSRTLELRKQMQGYGQPNLNTTIVKGIIIPLPTAEEQEYICQYLDKRCAAIDSTVEKKEKVIAKLMDYKKSLIYEVVTGKREVV